MNDRFIKKLWHTNRKIFLEEFSILQTIHSDGTVEHTYFEYKPKTQELERLSSCQIREINCTGLHDKNGKLVYEGDVVIYKGNLKVVVFDEINLCHCLLWVKHYNPQWKSSTSGLKYDKVTKTKKLEVIGNIYENKELLDEQFRKTVL